MRARGQTADQVAAQIGDEFGRQVRTAEELLAAPPRADTRPVYGIVVDDVDEAQDPERLIGDLLEPLAAGAAAWRIRLLPGLRTGADRTLLRHLGPHVVELPLDDPAYFEPTDLTEYGRRYLMADEPGVSSPYRSQPDLAGRVAAAVARRARRRALTRGLPAPPGLRATKRAQADPNGYATSRAGDETFHRYDSAGENAGMVFTRKAPR